MVEVRLEFRELLHNRVSFAANCSMTRWGAVLAINKSCTNHMSLWRVTAQTGCIHQAFYKNPASTRRWTSVGLMLGQRRRRWPDIKLKFVRRLVFAGKALRAPQKLRVSSYQMTYDVSLCGVLCSSVVLFCLALTPCHDPSDPVSGRVTELYYYTGVYVHKTHTSLIQGHCTHYVLCHHIIVSLKTEH